MTYTKCNLQKRTGRRWQEEHFSAQLKKMLALPEEVSEALKCKYMGKELPELPDYLNEQDVLKAGFRSADEYSLFSYMQWADLG